ncbi:MAG: amidohydrolase family protein, partial [Planctomycetota bacterium]|nr:amidohydrolase family protein [Planctomycetota bacterium]
GPAKRFRLVDRGEIRNGAFADLVVFDPEVVGDRATYAQPHQMSLGIEQVLVNGVQVVVDGQPVSFEGATPPGRALKFGV